MLGSYIRAEFIIRRGTRSRLPRVSYRGEWYISTEPMADVPTLAIDYHLATRVCLACYAAKEVCALIKSCTQNNWLGCCGNSDAMTFQPEGTFSIHWEKGGKRNSEARRSYKLVCCKWAHSDDLSGLPPEFLQL